MVHAQETATGIARVDTPIIIVPCGVDNAFSVTIQNVCCRQGLDVRNPDSAVVRGRQDMACISTPSHRATIRAMAVQNPNTFSRNCIPYAGTSEIDVILRSIPVRIDGVGDTDLSGSFDTSDLVQVLVSGEYEDDIELNSMWHRGNSNPWETDDGTSTK